MESPAVLVIRGIPSIREISHMAISAIADCEGAPIAPVAASMKLASDEPIQKEPSANDLRQDNCGQIGRQRMHDTSRDGNRRRSTTDRHGAGSDRYSGLHGLDELICVGLCVVERQGRYQMHEVRLLRQLLSVTPDGRGHVYYHAQRLGELAQVNQWFRSILSEHRKFVDLAVNI